MVVDFLTMSGTIVERKSEDLPLEKSPKYMLNIFCNRLSAYYSAKCTHKNKSLVLNKKTYSRKYQRFHKLKMGQSRFDWGKISLNNSKLSLI